MVVTPFQAALIIWAAGLALHAWVAFRGIRAFVNADVLVLCDSCRERRREMNMLGSAIGDHGWAGGLLIASALWPGVYVIKTWRYMVKGKPWRHRCNRV